jgi:hypothetical protein
MCMHVMCGCMLVYVFYISYTCIRISMEEKMTKQFLSWFEMLVEDQEQSYLQP